MKTIKVFYVIEPCLETKYEKSQDAHYGLHRDRCPDSGWGEFRWTKMEKPYYEEVEMTDELKQTLIEDICECYKGEKAYLKLTNKLYPY